MSVTPGSGADIDKTTIQLKPGTSATVLTTHQDISGKQNNLAFDGEYNASTNPVATVSTVTEAVSGLSGCEVSYDASTGVLSLDFSGT